MALGAGRWSVIRESLRDTMIVFGVRLTAGIIATVVAVRLSADLLFGLTAADAANFAGAVLVMILAGLAACIPLVRRATRIDPLGCNSPRVNDCIARAGFRTLKT
jgi:ABC-type antimicrobial peptide transport system permease subunit